jgi:FkbM family methyltransferase
VLVRDVAGLLRYWPRATLAAVFKLRPSAWKPFLEAYRSAASGTGSSTVQLRGDNDPITIRHGTSDFAVFCLVTLQEEYQCVPELQDVRTILDGGANIGLTTRYFLRRFPQARVVAVEPDGGNLRTAESNLSGLRDRCDIVHGALWSKSGSVEVVRDGFRDGREWSRHVRDPEGNLPAVPSYTIGELMDQFGFGRVDVLKIDIEGAEATVFAGNADFMDRVRCCAIELHDQRATDLFQRACRQHGFDWTVHGETTIAVRRAG